MTEAYARRLLVKMFQDPSLILRFLAISLPFSLPATSVLPHMDFSSGLRDRSTVFLWFLSVLVSLSSVWLGQVYRDLESKQSKELWLQEPRMASFSIINSSNFPIWLFSEWKLKITVSINYHQVYFLFYSILPHWFLTQQEIFQMHVLWNMVHKSLLLVRAAVSLWGSPFLDLVNVEKFTELPQVEICLSTLNFQCMNFQENCFLVRVLALSASSLTRTTSRTVCGMSVFRALLNQEGQTC